MLFYILLSINILCFVALFWLWWLIIKLYTNKHFRECPPYVPSLGAEKKIIIENVRDILKRATRPMTVLDPGCGSGGLIIKLAKEFPEHKFIGIEWSKFASKVATFKTRKLKNVTIVCQDMFEYDFSKADIIVCFLMDTLMEKFGEKVLKDNKKTQIVFSNSFKIPNLPLIEEIKTGKNLFFKNVYIYKVD